MDKGLRQRLIRHGSRYWHQGHHYPTLGIDVSVLDHVVPMNRTLPERPTEWMQCLVGEIATKQGNDREQVDAPAAIGARKAMLEALHHLQRWKDDKEKLEELKRAEQEYQREQKKASNMRWGDEELEASEVDPKRFFRGRLQLIAGRGYDGVLGWCALTDHDDGRTDWSAAVRKQMRDFALALPEER